MPCKICCSHTTSRKNSPLTESKVPIASGAGTNLKVGWGHRSGAKHKKFFGRAPPLFGSKSTISRFCERFRDDQYSLVCYLFAVLLLTVPPPVSSYL